MGTYSNYHGCLFVRFTINNIHGSDVVLTREEAVSLYRQLGIALQQNAEVNPLDKDEKKTTKAATKVTVTK
jgi:hypothetical protein